VGQLTAGLFLAGLISLFLVNWLSGCLGLLLLAAIVLYDFRHKGVSWAPVVMGFCRFLLYPLGASDGFFQTILPIPLFGLTLGVYVLGITLLARGETGSRAPNRRALLPLCLPLVVPLLAISTNGEFSDAAVLWVALFSCLLWGWMVWLLVPFWTRKKPSVGRVVSGLLAGIVLVDTVQVSGVLGGGAFGFLLLFGLSLLLQRTIPAT
jgi:4-hydroxybenzoate polyprenyltransferase